MSIVTKKSAAHLRLHVENPPADEPNLAAAGFPQLAALSRAFERTTGWQLRHQASPGGMGEAWSAPIEGGGRLALFSPVDTAEESVELAEARPLALALAGILSETQRLRRALWQREAELAAGVPVATRKDHEPHLAERLESVLKGGAEAVGCPAAALYLLDEYTSSLKLRASFGLPQDRLLAPARPLRGSVADLEALVGHAVVLEDTSLLPHWRCPEDFPSAVCVPVSSPSMPLGTLWIFSSQQRDFTPQETNLIEIIAGRLAADLEREMLLVAGVEAKQRDRQFDVAQRWQRDRLPSVAPLVDDYEIAGWTSAASGVGGSFHDWSVLPDGRLAVVVGDSQGTLLEAGLNAAALQAAVKAHGSYKHDAGQLLSRVNETLWTGSAGDQHAGLAYSLIDLSGGNIEFAQAGPAAALLLGANQEPPELIAGESATLGSEGETKYATNRRLLSPSGFLILMNDGARKALTEGDQCTDEKQIASLVHEHACEGAQQLVERLRHLAESAAVAPGDMSLVVVKRKRTLGVPTGDCS